MKKPMIVKSLYRKEDAADEEGLKESQFFLEDYETYPFIFDLAEISGAEPWFVDKERATILFFKDGSRKKILYPYKKIESLLMEPEKIFAKNN